ncbi:MULTISPECIES: hypothetical protein [unclassified Amycolatopsis]|nr:hypothetical protein [Amycolatopsis sp. ATCC 39116]
MTLDAASGAVSGTPPRADSRQVTDAAGKEATAAFVWFVFR